MMPAAGSPAMPSCETVADFLHAMLAAGVRPVEPITSRLGRGDLIRFQAEGDKLGRKNGWAILHLDGCPAGAFGHWRLGVHETWSARLGDRLSDEERQRLRREWRAKQEERDHHRRRGWDMAAEVANGMLSSAQAAKPDHPYLMRKGIDPEGFRQAGDLLLVPMVDIERRVWKIQRIGVDGRKVFLGRGRIEALFWQCGEVNDTLCVGEGCATMAAVRAATDLPVVATLGSNNLGAVARVWRERRPDLDIIICADDDPELVDNPHIRQNLGLEAAKAAALEVNARLALPPREAPHGT
jgi:putative DNA primase/helicase